MTSFAGVEIIDLTILDDSEEDLPPKFKSLVKKRHSGQAPSIQRPSAAGDLIRGSHDEALLSQHRISSLRSSASRARSSEDDRKIDEALRTEDVIVQRKGSDVPDKGSPLANRQATQGQRHAPVKDDLSTAKHGGKSSTPSVSSPASSKDRRKSSTQKQPHRVSSKTTKAGDVRSSKTSGLTNHAKSSPFRTSLPRALPHERIKAKDFVSRAQSANNASYTSIHDVSPSKNAHSQLPSLTVDCPPENRPADNVDGRVAKTLPKLATSASTLLHSTTLKAQRAQHADVLLYLDRVGIEWYYRDHAIRPFIVLAEPIAAVRDGLLGDIPNEAFSLNVNDQGELLIERKAETAVIPSTSAVFHKEPSSTIQMRDKRLVSPQKALSEASNTATKRVLAWLPSTEAITTGNNVPVVSRTHSKRRPDSKNKNIKAKSVSREPQTCGENNNANSYSGPGSDSDDLPLNVKRRRLNVSSDRRGSRVNEFEIDGTINKACCIPVFAAHSSMFLDKPKTRIPNYPLYSRGCLLRNRELDLVGCLNMQQSFTRLRESCLDTTIQPWRDWTGASKDVIRAVWAPDGMSFVIGSSTDLDECSLQYNKSNNLMWCDMFTNTIMELGDHKIRRPVLSRDTPNLSRVLDSHVFTTISDIAYGPFSTRFWTASYDKTVKVWDVEEDTPKCVRSIEYSNPIDILVTFDACPAQTVTTAQHSCNKAVEIYQYESNSSVHVPDPERAERYNLVPTSLAWGCSIAGTKALLAAGYGDRDNEAVRGSRGDIVIYNAEVQAKLTHLKSSYHYVYDLTWHTHEPWLAAAIPAKESIHAGIEGTQSHIRIWQPQTSERRIYDLDCLALDINRIIFNPIDSVSVSAACTDGSVYHYDLRQPQKILAKFEHGPSISQLDPNSSRESQDFGVQFISWNTAGTLLYTGSSDGKVKQWNPLLNNEDAFIEDIATLDAEISSGSFSPDFTNLLIGTANGSAHVFSSAPVSPWISEDEGQSRTESGQAGTSGAFKFRPARKSPVT